MLAQKRFSQPISVVESSGALAAKYHIPSRKYLAEMVKPNIAQGIQESWSSDVNSDLLLGLTAHWVDGNVQRNSAVL